jgi:hypothetical protein
MHLNDKKQTTLASIVSTFNLAKGGDSDHYAKNTFRLFPQQPAGQNVDPDLLDIRKDVGQRHVGVPQHHWDEGGHPVLWAQSRAMGDPQRPGSGREAGGEQAAHRSRQGHAHLRVIVQHHGKASHQKAADK